MKTNRLPVLETLYKSIAWPWYFRKRLSLALLPMLLALVCLELVSIYIPGGNNAKATMLLVLITFPLTVLYTITIHRIIILGFDSTPRLGMFEWRGREWNFLLYGIGLSIAAGLLVAVPLMMLFGALAGADQEGLDRVLMLVACLPAALLFARLSLVFPAIAVDSDFSVRQAWETGRGNTFQLAIVVYWAHVAGIAFFYLLPEMENQYADMLLTVVTVLLGYILWAIQIACLSFAYQYLVAEQS